MKKIKIEQQTVDEVYITEKHSQIDLQTKFVCQVLGID
jgi:hypothetical protein